MKPIIFLALFAAWLHIPLARDDGETPLLEGGGDLVIAQQLFIDLVIAATTGEEDLVLWLQEQTTCGIL